MLFRKLSASQPAPNNDKPDNTTKTALAGSEQAAQPANKQNEVAPAQKSWEAKRREQSPSVIHRLSALSLAGDIR